MIVFFCFHVEVDNEINKKSKTFLIYGFESDRWAKKRNTSGHCNDNESDNSDKLSITVTKEKVAHHILSLFRVMRVSPCVLPVCDACVKSNGI